ncbi:hypothetical protein P2H44_22630 [Albimonas sp. CAU 1670]|uniref:hypothetical protein n=1 Tax=Albimonas sp. CAU 1670 TaxID=3032599 RepID=UPI0023DC4622|nr:hypothetical protein [Albimonas sp. CAU 1670]MDF2235361.1 hypothetical protein [Albimonas sp. CAU 1670]
MIQTTATRAAAAAGSLTPTAARSFDAFINASGAQAEALVAEASAAAITARLTDWLRLSTTAELPDAGETPGVLVAFGAMQQAGQAARDAWFAIEGGDLPGWSTVIEGDARRSVEGAFPAAGLAGYIAALDALTAALDPLAPV